MKQKNNIEFGDGWFLVPTKSGKVALVESKISVGACSIEDLTDDQLKNANIELFNTYTEANAEAFKRVKIQLGI